VPKVPDWYDPDSPVRDYLKMDQYEFFEYVMQLAEKGVSILEIQEERAAAEREKRQRRDIRAEKKIQREIDKALRVDDATLARVQARFDAMLPAAYTAFADILDGLAANPDAWDAADIALVFSIGQRLCGFVPSEELVSALEAKQAAESRG
jgi:hypothetical protein